MGVTRKAAIVVIILSLITIIVLVGLITIRLRQGDDLTNKSNNSESTYSNQSDDPLSSQDNSLTSSPDNSVPTYKNQVQVCFFAVNPCPKATILSFASNSLNGHSVGFNVEPGTNIQSIFAGDISYSKSTGKSGVPDLVTATLVSNSDKARVVYRFMGSAIDEEIKSVEKNQPIGTVTSDQKLINGEFNTLISIESLEGKAFPLKVENNKIFYE